MSPSKLINGGEKQNTALLSNPWQILKQGINPTVWSMLLFMLTNQKHILKWNFLFMWMFLNFFILKWLETCALWLSIYSYLSIYLQEICRI